MCWFCRVTGCIVWNFEELENAPANVNIALMHSLKVSDVSFQMVSLFHFFFYFGFKEIKRITQ